MRGQQKDRRGLSRILLFLFMVFILVPFMAFAQTTVVSVLPADITVVETNEFNIEIQVSNVTALHGASIVLTFDPSSLKVLSASKGPFLSSGGQTTFFFPSIDNTAGKVQTDEAILGPFSVSGTGILSIIRFKALAVGDCDLIIAGADLRDSNNNTIPVTTEKGTVHNIPVPVELSTFTAQINDNLVELKWKTESETNNYGFNIERKIEENDFEKIGFVIGSGTTTIPQTYRFLDRDLQDGMLYYRLKQIDTDGTFQYSKVVEIKVSVPQRYQLEQNSPNPFNPETDVRYQLPNPEYVTLTLFNLLGQEMRILVKEPKPAGYFIAHWDGKDNQGREVPSGLFMYRIEAGSFVDMKKMLLLR